MSVKIRLRRMGKKKQPHYRIVATDSRAPRDGRFVENLGYYHPIHHPATLSVDLERVDYWVGRGAILSPTVRSLVSKAKAGGDEMVALAGAVTDADAGTDGVAANGTAGESAAQAAPADKPAAQAAPTDEPADAGPDKATADTEDASADEPTAATAEAADAAAAEDSEAAEADAQAAPADESGDASDGEAESAAAGDTTAEAASAEEAAGETNAEAEPADESPAPAEAEAAPDDGDA